MTVPVLCDRSAPRRLFSLSALSLDMVANVQVAADLSPHDWGFDVIKLFSDTLSSVHVPDLIRSIWRDKMGVIVCKLRFTHVGVDQLDRL